MISDIHSSKKQIHNHFVCNRTPSVFAKFHCSFTNKVVVGSSPVAVFHFLTLANFTIQISLICRKVMLVKNALSLYSLKKRVVRSDRRVLLRKFCWSYFYIAPLINFNVTVKRQQNISFAIFNMAFPLNYNKRCLYWFNGTRVKFKSCFCSYVYLMLSVC